MSDNPMEDLERELKPYRGRFASHDQLPATGRTRDDVLAELRAMAAEERDRWEDGYASGAVYQGDAEHVAFLNEVYALHSQSNPLHVDLWPSATKFEAEIVAMTAAMLGAGETPDEIVGAVSSGGSESILLAVKAQRDLAQATRGVTKPNLVLPASAHPAFSKAAQAFAIEERRVPTREDLRADVAATAEAIDEETVLVVGSAPGFPHGLIDPIEELSELARERGVRFHTDACLGGFVLPWAAMLGHDVPPFDFRLPGVTSMSADTHKFGYAAKGTSVVLYRGSDLRHHQYFTATDWPGGIYLSPGFAGSRPGALIAQCWAAMVTTGEDGYLAATQRIHDAADGAKRGIAAVDGLHVLGDPLFDVAFAADDPGALDIYRVMDEMGRRRWSLNGLHRPPALHLCVTLRHAEPGVIERFCADLADSVATVREEPAREGGMAPVYGAAASLPDRGAVADMLRMYLDLWYRV